MSHLNRSRDRDIAIVGMAVRVPGARTLDAFWHHIVSGNDCLTRSDHIKSRQTGVTRSQLSDPRYVPALPKLDGAKEFDNDFFDMTAFETERTDPSHRLFMECCFESLEHAAIPTDRTQLRVGVIGGSESDYRLNNLIDTPDDGLVVTLGTEIDYTATRVAHKLNANGSSMSVMAACATSLMAIHMGIQSLRRGETDAVVAGGCTTMLTDDWGYMSMDDGMQSPTGRVRPFDEAADGTVFGTGAGAVVLRRYEDAVADGQTIYGVLLGSGAANDGNPPGKGSFTAPSPEGQILAISDALNDADIDPETIGYVEAHGTATRIGDPTEVGSLNKVYRRYTDKTNYCGLGSLKANFGHLRTAAGVLSIVKTCLAMTNGLRPPLANLETPSSRINFADSPFFVSRSARDWPDDAGPRRAGVSAFGFGGANVHAVLEAAPPREPANAKPSGPYWFPMSAKTSAALARRVEDLANHIDRQPDIDAADLAHTLQRGRNHYAHRALFRADATNLRDAFRRTPALPPRETSGSKGLVFLFPGQGSQRVGMGKDYYDAGGIFRETVDECVRHLIDHIGEDIRELLYPGDDLSDSRAAESLMRTERAQPALFVVEYALAKALAGKGVEPNVLLGHSVGEIVAACLAGVFSLEDGLRIVAARSRLMQSCEPGTMLAVLDHADVVQQILPPGVEIASFNAPQLTVVSGRDSEIDGLAAHLEEQGIPSRKLHTSHAFHSAMMEPALPAFRELLATIPLMPPRKTVVSNLTGAILTDEQACDPKYWADQIRQPVQFLAGARRFTEASDHVFLEVGPGRVLSDLVVQIDPDSETLTTDATDAQSADAGNSDLDLTAGRLWQLGCNVEWSEPSDRSSRRLLPLPTYPFERREYWLRKGEDRTSTDDDLLYYAPQWLPSDPPGAQDWGSQTPWIVLADDQGLAETVSERMRMFRQTVHLVRPGETFAVSADGDLTVRPNSIEDFQTLLEHVQAAGPQHDAEFSIRVMDFWAYTGPTDHSNSAATFEEMSRLGHGGLIALSRAMSANMLDRRLDILVVGDGLFCLPGEGKDLRADKAALLGPARYIPREMDHASVRILDVPHVPGKAFPDWLVEGVMAEAEAHEATWFAMLRAAGRYRESFEAIERPASGETRLRRGGVVLVTGGAGGLGLYVAESMFAKWQARLVLTVRWDVPDPDSWRQRAETPDKVGKALAKIVALQDRGAEVLLVKADSTSRQDLERAVEAAVLKFGGVHGVVHSAGASLGRLVQQEQPDIDESMLAKVHGAFHLEELFSETPLDFLVHFSSVATVGTGVGHAAYAGSNFVLNALAECRRAKGLGFSLSIGWGAWEQLGMAVSFVDQGAAANARAAVGPTADTTPFHHPLIQRRHKQSDGVAVYSGTIDLNDHWIGRSHRLQDRPLLAGMVHLEVMRAVAADHLKLEDGFELAQVSFLKPLFLDQDQTQMKVEITTDSSGRKFLEVFAKRGSDFDSSDPWNTYSSCELKVLDSAAQNLTPESMEIIVSEVESTPSPAVAAFGGGSYIQGSERWACRVVARENGPETLYKVWIDDPKADPDEFGFYPPLLDQGATRHLGRFFPNGCLPVTIASVAVRGRLGLAGFVTARVHDERTSASDFMIYDLEGLPVLQMDRYEMMDIEASALVQDRTHSDAATKPSGGSGEAGRMASHRVQVARVGDFESIGVSEYVPPPPAPDEVQIRVVAGGLNFRDVLTALGQMPDVGDGPIGMGGECSGYVHALGSRVRGLKVGAPVVAMADNCFASFVNAKSDLVATIPDNVVMEEAAGIPIVFLSAHYALNELARIRPGERVLIHAASGGLGLACIQLAKAAGAEIFATAGREQKHDYLHSLGVEHVFSSRSLDFADDVLAATNGEGVDVVINSLAGEFLRKSVSVLRPFGRFVEMGKRDMIDNSQLGLAPFIKNLSFLAFDLGLVNDERSAEVGARLDKLMDRFAKRELTTLPTAIESLTDVRKTFERMSRGEHIGKIAIQIGGHTDDWRNRALEFSNRFGSGILPTEGAAAFQRLMSMAAPPSFVVATQSPIEASENVSGEALRIGGGQRVRPELEVDYRAAQTKTQAFLVDLWERTIGTVGIGVDDDYFDLGGDSIMAAQIMFAIFREYDLRLPMTVMERRTTIYQLAEEIEQQVEKIEA